MNRATPGAVVLWCVPRSRSTAFERMMYERGDHTCVHEPFSRVCDFGESRVGEHPCRSQAEVMARIDELAARGPAFVKDTLDFRFDEVLADAGFLARHRHALMVRDPREAITSHLRLDPAAPAENMGYTRLAELGHRIAAATGTYPHVVEATALVRDPHGTVAAFCRAMGIAYLPDALDFRREPPADWGRTGRWHAAAARSARIGDTGAVAPSDRTEPPGELVERYVRHHEAAYREITAHIR